MSKNIVFFDFSNHARAQVPIFTPKMKNLEFARLANFARLSTRKWDFRRRSRPRELAQRSQDDVSLNKLPQIKFNILLNDCSCHNLFGVRRCLEMILMHIAFTRLKWALVLTQSQWTMSWSCTSYWSWTKFRFWTKSWSWTRSWLDTKTIFGMP